MQGASAIQSLLAERKGAPLRVLIVWEPVLHTDIASPTTSTLARVGDARVAQFWDPLRLLSARLLPVLQADPGPVIGKPSLVTEDPVWDFVGVYAPGVRWSDPPPAPSFKGAPVVSVLRELNRHLDAGPARSARLEAGGTFARAR